MAISGSGHPAVPEIWEAGSRSSALCRHPTFEDPPLCCAMVTEKARLQNARGPEVHALAGRDEKIYVARTFFGDLPQARTRHDVLTAGRLASKPRRLRGGRWRESGRFSSNER